MNLKTVSGPVRLIIVLAVAWTVAATGIWLYSHTVADRLDTRARATGVRAEAFVKAGNLIEADRISGEGIKDIERRNRLDDWLHGPSSTASSGSL